MSLYSEISLNIGDKTMACVGLKVVKESATIEFGGSLDLRYDVAIEAEPYNDENGVKQFKISTIVPFWALVKVSNKLHNRHRREKPYKQTFKKSIIGESVTFIVDKNMSVIIIKEHAKKRKYQAVSSTLSLALDKFIIDYIKDETEE